MINEHERLGEVSVGMEQSEVRSILGEPFQSSAPKNEPSVCDTFEYETQDGVRYSHVSYRDQTVESVVTGRKYVCGLNDMDGELQRI